MSNLKKDISITYFGTGICTKPFLIVKHFIPSNCPRDIDINSVSSILPKSSINFLQNLSCIKLTPKFPLIVQEMNGLLSLVSRLVLLSSQPINFESIAFIQAENYVFTNPKIALKVLDSQNTNFFFCGLNLLNLNIIKFIIIYYFNLNSVSVN